MSSSTEDASASSTVDQELRTRLLAKDCTECRYTGTATCAFIASYLIYNSNAPYYASKPRQKLTIRLVALGLSCPPARKCSGVYYLGAARFFYFPPFTSLRDSPKE